VSNLSDLLPAGASAKQLTFTDSGSGIATKKPVILNSDGTVTEAGNVSASFGSAQEFSSGDVSNGLSTAYDPDNNRVCAVWLDSSDSYYGTAAVGQISGSSITWGTPLRFESAYTPYPDVAYDKGTDQFVITFVDGSASNYFGAKTAAYAATNTLTFGAKVNGPAYAGSTAVACNFSDFLAVYDTTSGMGIAGTISGTSITLGTPTSYAGGGSNTRGSDVEYDPNANKFLVVTADGSNSYNGYGFVATLSGTSISYGSGTTFNTTSSNNQTVSYDSTAQKLLVTYADLTASDVKGCVGTISSTSVSFGSSTQAVDTNSIGFSFLKLPMSYDPATDKTYMVYSRDGSTEYGYLLTATISSTSVSFADETAFTSVRTTSCSIVVDTTSNKAAIVYSDRTDTNNGDSQVYSPAGSNLTAQAFVGVADSAISASAAGSIIVQGGTVSGVSSGTGVSAGTAVQYSASNLADVYAADSVYDSTNNKVIVVYDGAGSGAGYGIVGTISGTSVSYGSAVQYSGGNARHSQVTYDSTNQRVVVVYSDDANSRYLTVAVGTVSGTSISWGTPVVADSTANDMYLGIDFDINAGKVLIIWKEDSTVYNYGIVGTVSGTSISFGTKAAVDTTYGYQMIGGLTYDANAQKHLFFRPRVGGGTVADGYVGTISGTSVSWGSATSATTTQSLSVGWGSYDSNAQKVVVTYRIGAGGMGSQVATISGTSVSFGTQVVVDASINPDFTTNYYDSTDQTIVAFGRATNYYGYVGTVSGTSISWSSASTLLLDAAFGYGLGTPAYDANADAGLILFANAGDSAAESAVTTAGALPLTTGTKYYVTTSGGFSSSADTPSVNAGLAISTTSLLLNGDS
jgi:hypothetical protein